MPPPTSSGNLCSAFARFPQARFPGAVLSHNRLGSSTTKRKGVDPARGPGRDRRNRTTAPGFKAPRLTAWQYLRIFYFWASGFSSTPGPFSPTPLTWEEPGWMWRIYTTHFTRPRPLFRYPPGGGGRSRGSRTSHQPAQPPGLLNRPGSSPAPAGGKIGH